MSKAIQRDTSKSKTRTIKIGNTTVHIKSIFTDKITLENALANIATQKLAELNKKSNENDKF